VHTEFWLGDLREIDHLKDLGVDVIVILNGVYKIVWSGMDCADMWRALVDAVMNLRVS
jgi:hypothetical protein